jgi:hypothetical protein
MDCFNSKGRTEMKRWTSLSSSFTLALALASTLVFAILPGALSRDAERQPAPTLVQPTLIYGIPLPDAADPVFLASPEELEALALPDPDLTTFAAPAHSSTNDPDLTSQVVEYIYGMPANCAADPSILMMPEAREACALSLRDPTELATSSDSPGGYPGRADAAELITQWADHFHGLPARCAADPLRMGSPEELETCLISTGWLIDEG